jgi:hypothetical protein
MLVSIFIAVSLVAGAHSACTDGGSSGGASGISLCNQAMAANVPCTDDSACTGGTVCMTNYGLG